MTTPGLPVPPRPCLNCTTPTRNQGGRCDTCTQPRRQQHNKNTAYYRTPEWRNLRTRILDRDHHQCVVCTSTQRLAIHHIKARKDGGADAAPNLVTLCHPCHSKIEAGDRHTYKLLGEHLHTSPHHNGSKHEPIRWADPDSPVF